MIPHSRAILNFVKASAVTWASYKLWKDGNPDIRGFSMKIQMADIVMGGALYRAERAKERERV